MFTTMLPQDCEYTYYQMKCGGGTAAAVMVVVTGVMLVMVMVVEEAEAWGGPVASLPEAGERLRRLQVRQMMIIITAIIIMKMIS